MTSHDQSERHRVRRLPERGHYDRATIHAILDEALVCHVGIVEEGRPVVIPTLLARDGDRVLLHGSSRSRLLGQIGEGHEVSLAVTLLDGLVLARSVFHHSVNYRGVVLFGRGGLLEDEGDKLAALERLADRLVPGRWGDARQPNAQELKATSVAAVPIDLASAKIREGPPKDDPDDLELAVWAGVIPLRLVAGEPEPDPRSAIADPPPYLRDWLTRRAGDRPR